VKTRVFDPVSAAMQTGGCTYEPYGCGENGIVGWWTYTHDTAVASEIGYAFDGERDAMYLPTLQKDGHPVNREVVEQLKDRARQLGLTEVSQASGMWVLGNDDDIPQELRGTIQSETIWIFWCHEKVNRAALAQLAHDVRELCLQDAVAREEAGELLFVS
jgi:hypothetical protein